MATEGVPLNMMVTNQNPGNDSKGQLAGRNKKRGKNNEGSSRQLNTDQGSQLSHRKLGTTQNHAMEPKQKADKFKELMKVNLDAQKQLEGLSARFNEGVGMGKTYYDK